MTVELPEYHNNEQVIAAVKKQEGVIAAAKAIVEAEQAKLSAIRKMCDHKYSQRYSMGRDAGRCCDVCGDWR